MNYPYHIISKNWDIENNYRNCQGNGAAWVNKSVISPKYAGGMVDDVDPGKTSPLLLKEQSDMGLHCLLSPICPSISSYHGNQHAGDLDVSIFVTFLASL